MSEALSAIRNGEKLTTRQEASLILKLSLPAILAQISSIIMQYIDASMVGHLGAKDDEGARVIVKWGLNCTFVFSILVMIICVLISSKLQ